MKKILYLSAFTLICVNCNKEQKNIQQITLVPEFVTDSIFTRMPGNSVVSKNYFLWEDPYANETFVKMIDLKSKLPISDFLGKGLGPEEFITPTLGQSLIHDVFIYDLNSNKTAYISIDNLLDNKEYLTINRNMGDVISDATRVIEIDENTFIALNLTNDNPFSFWKENNVMKYGKYPIDKKINNSWDIFQGHLKYSLHHKCLIYTTFSLPYIAIYDVKDTEIQLLKESFIDKMPSYSIEKGDLILDNAMSWTVELALTRDYIVTLQDEKKEFIPFKNYTESHKSAHTLHLYNYDLELIKIVDIQKPIIRLAASNEDNTVYAIIVDPEYTVVKLEL